MTITVAVTTNYGHWGSFMPQHLFEPGATNMIGGGETAMLNLSTALAKAGMDVTLFYDVERPGTYYGVQYRPKYLKLPMLLSADYDVLISWEDNEAVAVRHRADLVIYSAQCNAMQIGILDAGIDGYQFVSQSHADHMFQSDPTVDGSKIFLVPNGVDLRRYENKPEREPYRVIHSSSPDRGLHYLLDIWPEVKKRVPEASLHIFYDMKGWFDIVDNGAALDIPILTSDIAQRVKDGIKKTEGMDVFLRGPVGQWQLAQEQMMSRIMVYPCSPVQYTEGFSVSILEGLAAGTPIITSDADALKELWPDDTVMIPLPFEGKQEVWIREIVSMLTDNEKWEAASKNGLETAASYTWDSIGAEYAALIEQKLVEKRTPKEKEWITKKTLKVAGVA